MTKALTTKTETHHQWFYDPETGHDARHSVRWVRRTLQTLCVECHEPIVWHDQYIMGTHGLGRPAPVRRICHHCLAERFNAAPSRSAACETVVAVTHWEH